MDKATKILILAALVGLIALPIKTLAQEDIPVKISEAVAMDENITAADLGIAEPMLLPTSPYYPVKNIWRGVRTFFTFNPVKKAELKFQFANEITIYWPWKVSYVMFGTDEMVATIVESDKLYSTMMSIFKILRKCSS